MAGSEEESHRLYCCLHCGVQVRICRRCDRGNVYCVGECAQSRRRECLRRAGARYQCTFAGAVHHAARQRAWRRRRSEEKVTHQGSVVQEPLVTVVSLETDTAIDDEHSQPRGTKPVLGPRCSFCSRPLGRFTRWGPLRGGP